MLSMFWLLPVGWAITLKLREPADPDDRPVIIIDALPLPLIAPSEDPALSNASLAEVVGHWSAQQDAAAEGTKEEWSDFALSARQKTSLKRLALARAQHVQRKMIAAQRGHALLDQGRALGHEDSEGSVVKHAKARKVKAFQKKAQAKKLKEARQSSAKRALLAQGALLEEADVTQGSTLADESTAQEKARTKKDFKQAMHRKKAAASQKSHSHKHALLGKHKPKSAAKSAEHKNHHHKDKKHEHDKSHHAPSI